jgi:uncharacterized protein YxeA
MRMNNRTKNILIVILIIATAASLAYAFQAQNGGGSRSSMTVQQAEAIKSKVISLRTDKEQSDYLNSVFNGGKRKISVGLSKSKASENEWCGYWDYYEQRAADVYNEYADGGYQDQGKKALSKGLQEAAWSMRDKCLDGLDQ